MMMRMRMPVIQTQRARRWEPSCVFLSHMLGESETTMTVMGWREIPGLLRRGFAVLFLYNHAEAAPEIVALLATAREESIFRVSADDGFWRTRNCRVRERDIGFGTGKNRSDRGDWRL